MAKAYVCEKCGITHYGIFTKELTERETVVKEAYDLCENCLQDFSRYMSGLEKITYINPDKISCGDCGRRTCEVNSNTTAIVFCTAFNRTIRLTEKACYFFKPIEKR